MSDDAAVEGARQDSEHAVDLEEARRHLPPVVDHLDAKFDEVGRDHVEEVVTSTFEALGAEATIPDHLAALTQHQAQEQLLAEDRSDGDHPTG